jgi:phosphoserine phosphatase RsbU/P
MDSRQPTRAMRVQRRRVEHAFARAYGQVDDPAAVDALRDLREELARVWPLHQHTIDNRESLSSAVIDSLTPRSADARAQDDGLSIGHCYDPGNLYAGGDFYDVLPTGPRRWRLCLGDVRGKGASAAATALMVRHTLRTAAYLGLAPSEALRVAHDLLLFDGDDDPEPRFCTAAVVQADLGADAAALRLALAGHPPVLLVRSCGEVQEVDSSGTALALLETLEVSDVRVDLTPGDLLVLYSDGVTEARHGTDRFGDDRLLDVVTSCRGMPAPAVVECLQEAVTDFRSDESQDDVTVLAVSYRPGAGAR